MALDYRAFIRKRLQKTSVELPDVDIDLEYGLVLAELLEAALPKAAPKTRASLSDTKKDKTA